MEVYHGEQIEQDGYELFRRAIVDRDTDAWTESVARYRLMLVAWARHYGARSRINEPCHDIADQALARAWKALSPARFATFPHLDGLLAYLRTCVASVVIDYARAQRARERAMQRLEVGTSASPEQIVLEKVGRAELWSVVNALAVTPQERTILTESFVLELPPRTILTRHPELFANITAVYDTKRALLRRLQHSGEVQRLRREWLAA
jgi:DNA-directed RNA polymerase specialized sigma24 family protein